MLIGVGVSCRISYSVLTYLYLNAKVLQHLVKCLFLRLTSPVICLANNMKIRTVWLVVAELQQQFLVNPQFLKSQSYSSLHFIPKKDFNQYLFSKSEGIRLFYAYRNVHYVYTKALICDVIDRLNTTEHQ